VEIYVSVTEKPAKQSIQHPHVSKQTEEDVWEKAITGAGAKEIAHSLKLSVASVYRSIRAVSGGAHRWKQVKVMKKRDTRRERFLHHYLNSLAHECPDYSWLYRNDRHWLMASLDKHGADKVHRKPGNLLTELDTLLAEKVIKCARSIRALPGKPARVCKTRIGRELDTLARFEKQLDRLPLCADALASVCESRDDFHLRRLVWAANELMRLGVRFTRSSLYRLASIRDYGR